jgi:hypothetical protein
MIGPANGGEKKGEMMKGCKNSCNRKKVATNLATIVATAFLLYYLFFFSL